MNKLTYSTALAVMLGLLSGCGSSAQTSTDTSTQITVERGPVLNAYVMDAKFQFAKEDGNGKYTFKNKPVYPLKVFGGFIDINRNGIIDEGDINNTLSYETEKGKSVTLVSSIAKNKEIKEYLNKAFYLSDAEIDNKLPDNDKAIAAVSDEVFAYCIEHNITDASNISLDDLKSIEADIQYKLQQYSDDDNRSEVEKELVKDLKIKELNSTQIDTIVQTGDTVTQSSLNSVLSQLPEYNLTAGAKETLSHMWNEEKLAHDLYLKLYDLYPNKVFYTIATRSEARHEASVQNLIKKYDLNITSSDFNGSYNEEELAKYGVGEFILPEIQKLYNDLYDSGKTSEVDALKVGCMVEVTDVNDINEYLEDNSTTPDMKIVFEHLRNGSYHHYWAFDRQLKKLGVENGCCSLGDEYCKTEEEYPKIYGPQK